jgi:hypothetical protein
MTPLRHVRAFSALVAMHSYAGRPIRSLSRTQDCPTAASAETSCYPLTYPPNLDGSRRVIDPSLMCAELADLGVPAIGLSTRDR